MGKYVGAFITLVVAAAVALVIITQMGTLGAQRPAETAANAGQAVTSSGATLKHVSIVLQTFPMDPYSDPDFVAKNITGQTDFGTAWPGPGTTRRGSSTSLPRI